MQLYMAETALDYLTPPPTPISLYGYTTDLLKANSYIILIRIYSG